MDHEASNFEQIERLNQRGGRTLSVVDLIEAGTLTVEMAAVAMRALHGGASLLTGARPGGVGKTTLMAALMHLMPPGERMVTVDSPRVLSGVGREAERACYLVHEIGAGQWYGYLWGPPVAEFVALAGTGGRIVSCLHADLLEELVGVLCAPPLNVEPADLARVGLILFIHVVDGRRRVASFYEADGQGGHRLRFWWNRKSGEFEDVAGETDPDAPGPYLDFVQRIVQQGDARAEQVRAKVLEFYGGLD